LKKQLEPAEIILYTIVWVWRPKICCQRPGRDARGRFVNLSLEMWWWLLSFSFLCPSICVDWWAARTCRELLNLVLRLLL
jgi:hypothetical protein